MLVWYTYGECTVHVPYTYSLHVPYMDGARMKNISFKVEDDFYTYFQGHAAEDGQSMAYVLRALVRDYGSYRVSISGGNVVLGKNGAQVSAGASPSFGVSAKPKGRPPKPDESWKMVPGCTSPAQFGILSTFAKLPPKVQEAIKQDGDSGWYEKCFEAGSLCLLTEDTYIRKNGLAVSHRFLGDKQ